MTSPPLPAAESPLPLMDRTKANGPAADRVLQSSPSLRELPVSRPRVLHVINGEHYSGAERVQDLLALQLPHCGYDVGFVCVKPGKFPAARQATEVPLHEVPMTSRFDGRAIRQICRIAVEGEYALLHAHTPRSVAVASVAAAWTGRPLVYHVHSPTACDSTHRWRNWLNARIERFSLRRARALITVSESLRGRMIAAGFSPEQVFTVANGVAAPATPRSPVPPRGTWTLGMTALFRPRKGLEVLLEALAILQAARIPVHLRAVGPFETESYEQEILRRVAALGIADRITWTGFTTDVASELTQMDLFVLPSLFGEGLPMVVLEAMAAGIPVIASRVEGIPEAIEHGVSGLLAEPRDPQSLADGITAIVGGHFDWTALRSAALERHATHFSDRQMATRLAAVYRQLLA